MAGRQGHDSAKPMGTAVVSVDLGAAVHGLAGMRLGAEVADRGARRRGGARSAHCGADRPPAARWAEGPVCDTCYTTALRRRGTCTDCGDQRRLVSPPGPGAVR